MNKLNIISTAAIALIMITASGCKESYTPIVFEDTTYEDSLTNPAKIYDYQTDSYIDGIAKHYFNYKTIKAVKGNKEGVEFINKWLTLEITGEKLDTTGNALTVSEEYSKLEKEGVNDMQSAFKTAAKKWFDEAVEMCKEIPFESGNSYEENIEIGYNNGRLLSLVVNGYIYYAGGAHGLPLTQTATFDMTTREALISSDMVKPEIKPLVLKRLKEWIGEETWESMDLENMTSHDLPAEPPYFTDKGIVFRYSAYEAGPYALGTPEVEINYNDAEPYLTDRVKKLLIDKFPEKDK